MAAKSGWATGLPKWKPWPTWYKLFGPSLGDSDEPPLRWAAGADAVDALEQKGTNLVERADAHCDLSSSLAHDDARRTPSE